MTTNAPLAFDTCFDAIDTIGHASSVIQSICAFYDTPTNHRTLSETQISRCLDAADQLLAAAIYKIERAEAEQQDGLSRYVERRRFDEAMGRPHAAQMHEGAGAGTPTPNMSGLETGRADDTQAFGAAQGPSMFRIAYSDWAAATAAYELAPEDTAEHVVLSARRDVLHEEILALLPQLRTADDIMDAILFATIGGQHGVDHDHADHIVAAIKRIRDQEASA